MTTPESQDLESFFHKLTTPVPVPPGEETDAMRQFNSLFEKLSALDELTWEPQVPAPSAAASGATGKGAHANPPRHTAPQQPAPQQPAPQQP
ncbi:MAG: hypothetical protein HY342_05540, partial [Candidatus Lambdaproteobacteria bacterium]|nr:hypothetical protein [Candidatus Lambdaproteobacteria bacterium]